ncbi:MAG: M20 family metallopeptidase [Nitrososphaeria archaeon]
MLSELESSVIGKFPSDAVISLAQKMVQIDSQNPPGNEKCLADYMANLLKGFGLEVMEYDFKPNRPNVVALYKGRVSNRTLIFNGHLDTVPFGDLSKWSVHPLEGVIRNGRLYGRGSADMKSSIAAFTWAVKHLIDQGVDVNGNVLITLTSDEEDSCVGADDILKRGYSGTACIVGEPSHLQVIIAHKGFARFKLTTFGKLAHASAPDEGKNAIYKMAKAIIKLEQLGEEYKNLKGHPLLGHPTLSVGVIKGGSKDNVVPDVCEITVDRRLLPGESPEGVDKELRCELDKMVLEDPAFEYSLSLYNSLPASETDMSNPIVGLAKEAIKDLFGREPVVEGMPATTEMFHFVKSGIPTIVLGCGDIKVAHTADESILLEEIVYLTKIYMLIILRYLKPL